MAPSRAHAGPSTAHTSPGDASTSSGVGPKRTQKARKHTHAGYRAPPHGNAALPGVQKLKAALRQTRRLLAKDNLAADARVVAERKLKAQEAELAAAQTARTERAMAVRYHKVKFFERQKVVRKIAQTNRALRSDETSMEGRKALKKTLKELRVDLNYILHYPKTRKYISLFPPSSRGAVSPATVNASEQAQTDAEREALRKEIRGRMKVGELSEEPEKGLEGKTEMRIAGEGGAIDEGDEEDVDMEQGKDVEEVEEGPTAISRKGAKVKAKKAKESPTHAKPPVLGGDDFFAADED